MFMTWLKHGGFLWNNPKISGKVVLAAAADYTPVMLLFSLLFATP